MAICLFVKHLLFGLLDANNIVASRVSQLLQSVKKSIRLLSSNLFFLNKKLKETGEIDTNWTVVLATDSRKHSMNGFLLIGILQG